MMPGDAVLIAGGYGVVGRQAAELIRQSHPELPLVIAGRSSTEAESLSRALTNARGIRLDVTHPDPMKGEKPRAILAIVNDPSDFLLLQAVREAIPYVDVTRWTEHMRLAISRLAAESVRAPVLLSSGWMAGVAAVCGRLFFRGVPPVKDSPALRRGGPRSGG